MKNGKKIVAWFLSLCMVLSIVPMYSLLAESSHKTETDESYTNNFNVGGDLSLLTEDFAFYLDTKASNNNSMSLLTLDGELASYVTVEKNRLERIFNSQTEYDAGNNGNRPYWGMMYYTYKNRQVKDFSLETDAYFPTSGTSYNAITVGSMGGGFKSNGGYTIGFQHMRVDGVLQLQVFCGTAAEVKTYFDDWYIHESANGHKAAVTATDDYKYKIKIEVRNGVANVYIDDVLVMGNRNVGKKEGFLSLCNGIANGSYYDNLSLDVIAGEPYIRVEEDGKYQNNFNETTLSALSSDFTFYHDTKDKSTNSLKNITNDIKISNYMTVENGKLERVFNSNEELQPWEDGNRPYWCMTYYTYKNQKFKDFSLTVDAHLSSWGTSYHAITVGSNGGGFKSNGGYTLGFQIKDNKLCTFLGNASAVQKDFDDWYIHDTSNKKTVDQTSDNLYTIKLTVENGLATVEINGVAIYVNRAVGEVDGYISLCNGISTGSYFDNLSIESIKPVGNIRVEETGKYQNNFNSIDLETLAGDFNFYHDTTSTKNNSLKDITSDETLSKYMTVANGVVERKFNSEADFEPGKDGNRPYWSMMYYTYKNQSFTEFTMTVDAYLNNWGSTYHAITVGTMGDGFKSNGGYTLGFQIRNGKLNTYLGKAGDVKTNFDDWYIHDSANTSFVTEAADKMYKIEMTVKEGLATVKINGETVYKDHAVGELSGYISLCNGVDKNGSYFDNFQIEGLQSSSIIESADGSEYLNKFTSGLTEISLKDFKAFYSDNLSSSENLLTEEGFTEHWKLSGGAVVRKDQSGEYFDETHFMAMMTFIKKKYNSFSYECDFVFGGAPGRIGFGIGQQTLGTYPTNENGEGGLILLFDSSGNASLKGYAGGLRYSNGASTDMLRGGLVNHLKMTYYNNFLTVELNDKEIFYMEILDLNGYVSFMASKVPNFSVDNFKIIDYNKVTVDPELQEKVIAIEKVNDIKWDRTEDNTNALVLPQRLNITTDKNAQKEVRILWGSEDYKPSYPGVYHFVGTPMMPAGGLLINPDNIVTTCTVTVTVDYDVNTTFKYYIDDVNDFERAEWSSRYASDPRAEDLLPVSAKSLYYIDEGRLRRLDSSGDVGDHVEMTSLIYTGRKFRNFQLDVDFRQGGNTWGQAMVGFAIEELEAYVTYGGGGAMSYLTMEGNSRFRGALIENTNSYGEVRSPSNSTQYAETWRDGMHHMRLRVTKRRAVLEIDGVEVLEARLKESYTGGYISLMSNKNTAIWDNLSVTTLDYEGNVISFTEHDNLPDTFSEIDPLIGEEPFENIKVEILGLAYNTDLNGKYLGSLNQSSGSSPNTGIKFPIYVFASVLVLAGFASLMTFKTGTVRRGNKIKKGESL